MQLQVNALSNIRKARLGRLDPVFKKREKPPQSRNFSALPPELIAEHEAKRRAFIAKRLRAQGDTNTCQLAVDSLTKEAA